MSSTRTRQLFTGPSESPVFCFIHLPGGGRVDPIGVVLVPPFGNEYFRHFRSYVMLADRLCASGRAVIRFDLAGTGDSAGEDEQMAIPRWIQDVGTAIDALRREAGIQRFALVGRRLGATLALLAAAGRSDVDRLVLWDPIASGARYLEELKDLDQSYRSSFGGAFGQLRESGIVAGDPASVELLGQRVTRSLFQEIARIDLQEIAARAWPRLLLLDTDAEPRQRSLADALAAGGTELTSVHRYDSSAIDVANPLRVYVPAGILRVIEEWLTKG